MNEPELPRSFWEASPQGERCKVGSCRTTWGQKRGLLPPLPLFYFLQPPLFLGWILNVRTGHEPALLFRQLFNFVNTTVVQGKRGLVPLDSARPLPQQRAAWLNWYYLARSPKPLDFNCNHLRYHQSFELLFFVLNGITVRGFKAHHLQRFIPKLLFLRSQVLMESMTKDLLRLVLENDCHGCIAASQPIIPTFPK